MSTHKENVAAYRDLQARRRDSLIASAVRTRKIAPDRAEDYARMYDADPLGIHHLLTAPVAQGGLLAGNAAVFNPLPPPVEAEYPKEWLAETGAPRGQVEFEDGGMVAAQALAAAPPSGGALRPPTPAPGRITLEP